MPLQIKHLGTERYYAESVNTATHYVIAHAAGI